MHIFSGYQDLLQQFSSVLNQFSGLKPFTQASDIFLFDSSTAAQDIALMLNAEWDGCNSISMPSVDEVALNTAAQLVGASWCKSGDSVALLTGLIVDEFISRYAAGERHFNNANLRCAMLASLCLKEVKLNCAHLSWANLSQTNLSGADLTAADLSNANLTAACLSQSDLVRTNLTRANLELADLRGANLTRANLSEACLREADLTGANLSLADLRGADLSGAKFEEACLTDAKLNLAQMEH